MFRTSSRPGGFDSLPGTIGAILVVLKIAYQLYSFIQALPKKDADRVALLEARLQRIELDLEITKPMPPVVPTP